MTGERFLRCARAVVAAKPGQIRAAIERLVEGLALEQPFQVGNQLPEGYRDAFDGFLEAVPVLCGNQTVATTNGFVVFLAEQSCESLDHLFHLQVGRCRGLICAQGPFDLCAGNSVKQGEELLLPPIALRIGSTVDTGQPCEAAGQGSSLEVHPRAVEILGGQAYDARPCFFQGRHYGLEPVDTLFDIIR
jgi:hypothetical protein